MFVRSRRPEGFRAGRKDLLQQRVRGRRRLRAHGLQLLDAAVGSRTEQPVDDERLTASPTSRTDDASRSQFLI
jgi:hypothetical protein